MLIMPESVTRSAYRLSKSRFLSGLQCHKRLYLEVHAPALATKPDAATQAILDMGTELGELARRRFPGGRLVEVGYRQSQEALAQTEQLLQALTSRPFLREPSNMIRSWFESMSWSAWASPPSVNRLGD